MKLARISHERCRDIDATTYVWVPDGWDEDDFEKAVSAAKEKYDIQLSKYAESSGEPPTKYGAPHKIPFEAMAKDFPDKTATELISIWEEQKALYKEWKDIQNAARVPFRTFLEDEGLVPFYSVEADFETTIYWGHKHGTRIDYEDTRPMSKDLVEPPKPPRRTVVRTAFF